jgi:DNA topoisomerase IA
MKASNWAGRLGRADHLHAHRFGARFQRRAGPGARNHRVQRFGQPYLPEKPNFYKSKKDAQDAHEAIRPTDAARTPEEVKPFLSEDMFKLYQLIWQRFVASQMVPAVFDQTTVDMTAGDYTFRATGSVQKFDGYLAVYQVSAEDDEDADPDANKALCRLLPKAKSCVSNPCAPNSILPSRRRAIRKRRW